MIHQRCVDSPGFSVRAALQPLSGRLSRRVGRAVVAGKHDEGVGSAWPLAELIRRS